jgi:Ras GTPase-activating protein 1
VLFEERALLETLTPPVITVQCRNAWAELVAPLLVDSNVSPYGAFLKSSFFSCSDVPCDVVSFTLTVHNKGKRGKDTEVAELHVELTSLGNGEEKEEWYTLSGLTPMGEWGSLRLRTRYVLETAATPNLIAPFRYLHDLVMPAEEYSPLQQLLLQPGLASVKTLAEISHADRAPLATALLRVFRAEGRETELLIELNSAEVSRLRRPPRRPSSVLLCLWQIERETETSTLFRAASLSTTLMDLYMRAECRGFLQAAVLETVLRLLDSKQSAELNPAKMDSLDDACNNAEFLLQVLDQVALSIFMSADACPRSVRYICGCLQKSVAAKWADERLVRARVVSGFIFLRLLCPALLNPRQFGLVGEQPSPSATRSLVMVAKCLQNLANLVEFGGKVRQWWGSLVAILTRSCRSPTWKWSTRSY